MLRGVSFTVFGCGNSDWVQTYQKIPKLCDELLEKHGGRRLLERGEGDASLGNFFQVFDEYQGKLWKTLSKVTNLNPSPYEHVLNQGVGVFYYEDGRERFSD